MSQYYINFTYESPTQDFSKNIGLNPNSTLNIRYTLGAMRNMLSENIKIIDELLENSDKIENIEVTETNYLGIRIKEGFKIDSMINKKIINAVLDESSNSDFSDEDESETNTDRLSILQNLFGSGSESFGSESSSDSDIVLDIDKEKYLCDKYQEFL